LFDVDLEPGLDPSSAASSSKHIHLPLFGQWAASRTGKRNEQEQAATDLTATTVDDGLQCSTAGLGLNSQEGLSTYYKAANSYKEEDDQEDANDDGDNQRLLGSAFPSQPGYFTSADATLDCDDASTKVVVGFEFVTASEHGWMALSTFFVLLLVLVAVLISIDVIDWPGDGLGKN
jgi:hypothetical protein